MRNILINTISILLRLHDFLFPIKVDFVETGEEEEMAKDILQEVYSGKKNKENDKYKVWLFIYEKFGKIYWNVLVGTEIDLIRKMNLMRINFNSSMHISTEELARIIEGAE